jgi:hypothetical protein
MPFLRASELSECLFPWMASRGAGAIGIYRRHYFDQCQRIAQLSLRRDPKVGAYS